MNRLPQILLFSAFSTAAPLHAAVVTSTGFEEPEYVAGNLTNTSTLPVYQPGASPSSGAVVSSAGSPFGGSGNQYVILNSLSSAFTVTTSTTSLAPLSTFHFDYYERSTTGTLNGNLHFGLSTSADLGTTSYGRWAVDDGTFAASTNTTLASGTAPSLQTNRHYKFFVLYNGSGAAQNASTPGGGTISLGIGQMGLFAYDTVTGSFIDGGRYDSPSGALTPTRFMFRGYTGGANQNEIYIDNFTYENTLNFGAVPEPSSALLALGATGLLILRRARKI